MSDSKKVSMKRNIGTLLAAMMLIALVGLAGVPSGAGASSVVPEVPVKGKVTVVDLGARECPPCKMMAPVMEELEKEYHATGKAAILFIDVWKNKEQAQKFGLRVIPTQIFYDKGGKEVYRHEGFLDKKGMVYQLECLGVF